MIPWSWLWLGGVLVAVCAAVVAILRPACVTVTAAGHEPVVVERLDVAIRNLPQRLAGTSLVVLSDLHMNEPHELAYISPAALARTLELVNSLQPSLV